MERPYNYFGQYLFQKILQRATCFDFTHFTACLIVFTEIFSAPSCCVNCIFKFMLLIVGSPRGAGCIALIASRSVELCAPGECESANSLRWLKAINSSVWCVCFRGGCVCVCVCGMPGSGRVCRLNRYISRSEQVKWEKPLEWMKCLV